MSSSSSSSSHIFSTAIVVLIIILSSPLIATTVESAGSPVIVTYYTARGDCTGTSSAATFVQDQCITSTSSGSTTYTTYGCNATYVLVNEWSGAGCSGTKSTSEIERGSCVIAYETSTSTSFTCSAGKVLGSVVVIAFALIVAGLMMVW